MELTRRTMLKSPAALAAPLPAALAATPKIDWKARWIWYPEQRTISRTFVLFRKTFELAAVPAGAVPAWVSGNSRYQLWVNGRFVQRGPAPSDPRYWDVDPVDLAPHLHAGRNVVAAVVCFLGGGDGTYVPSAPDGSGEGQGFLFQCDALGLASGEDWRTLRPRCWRHGSYQRWFLRCLQEEFDARHYPEGWASPEYDDRDWKAALVSRAPVGRPNLGELPKEGWRAGWLLHPRTIPPLIEARVAAPRIANAGWVEWQVEPEEYFECYPADAFTETEDRTLIPSGGVFPLRLPPPNQRSVAVTFDFGREVVGHPYVKVRAPAGAVVEVTFCERQTPGKLVLRPRPKFGQWLRVTCREGITEYEAFEYDAFRQLQLLIRNAAAPVEILEAGVKERNYAWLHEPDFSCSDGAVQRAFQASVNTHKLVTQETPVDNNTRERQQYAGDLDHAKLASYYGFGEVRQPARMLRTFAQGQSQEGWFMDSWPAWDRCQRLFQKHLDLTHWGAIIDHAMQFGIAAAEHQLWDADKALLADLTPRMAQFDQFLQRSVKADGLLPVEGWVWQTVWIDHIGFHNEDDKHCALNLYWAGFLTRGLARLLEWNGQAAQAAAARARAAAIVQRVRRIYWSAADSLYVDNLPRRTKDGAIHVHARTLAMALMFDQVPKGSERRAVDLLGSFPTGKNDSILSLEGGRLQLGFNYPLNDIWRLWALGRHGRADLIVKDLRERWSDLPSVRENGTYAEFWNPRPSESGDVWCQSNPVPIAVLYSEVLGIRPTAPGFAAYELRPQTAGLAAVSGTVHTVRGPIRVEIQGRKLRWTSPEGVNATLILPGGARRQRLGSDKERTWEVDLG